jgi:hypothetical protein
VSLGTASCSSTFALLKYQSILNPKKTNLKEERVPQIDVCTIAVNFFRRLLSNTQNFLYCIVFYANQGALKKYVQLLLYKKALGAL